MGAVSKAFASGGYHAATAGLNFAYFQATLRWALFKTEKPAKLQQTAFGGQGLVKFWAIFLRAQDSSKRDEVVADAAMAGGDVSYILRYFAAKLAAASMGGVANQAPTSDGSRRSPPPQSEVPRMRVRFVSIS